MQACNTLKGWDVSRLNDWRSLRYVNREVCCLTVKSIYDILIEDYMVKKTKQTTTKKTCIDDSFTLRSIIYAPCTASKQGLG